MPPPPTGKKESSSPVIELTTEFGRLKIIADRRMRGSDDLHRAAPANKALYETSDDLALRGYEPTSRQSVSPSSSASALPTSNT